MDETILKAYRLYSAMMRRKQIAKNKEHYRAYSNKYQKEYYKIHRQELLKRRAINYKNKKEKLALENAETPAEEIVVQNILTLSLFEEPKTDIGLSECT